MLCWMISSDPVKVQGIKDAEALRDRISLIFFLGAAGYLQHPRFAATCEALNRLFRKGVRYVWSDEQQMSFNAIKKAFVNATSLSLPRLNVRFEIHGDASDIGMGVVLSQFYDDVRHYLARGSKLFDDTQCSQSTAKKEAFSIIWSCQIFEPYIVNLHCGK